VYLKIIFSGEIDLSPNSVCPKFVSACGRAKCVAGGVGVFPALLGPGEAEELRWCLDKFVIRPSEQISEPRGQSIWNVSIFGRCPHGPEKTIRHRPDMMMKVRSDRSDQC
jgi:hypothetical protein